jgi:DNA-damage-inducible protein D
MSNEQQKGFEALAKENGSTWWSAREFMSVLGYDDWDDFNKLIRKTQQIYLRSEWFDLNKEFRYYDYIDGDYTVEDYKLSRFACFILAMNGNTEHPEVIEAQTFFAQTVEQFQDSLSPEDLERFGIRGQLKEAFTDLNKTFKKHDGKDHARFSQAGVIGMYNQPNYKLAKSRDIPASKLYDTMNRTELAANLFRVTQTEERIKSRNIVGQALLENAHKQVGQEVRKMVQQNTGKSPEHLPQAEQPVNKIESSLKKASKKLRKMDE